MSYYSFIRVDGTRRVAVNKDFFTSRNIFKDIYNISFTFETLTPIHIGSGDVKIINSTPLYLHIKDADGHPTIPGSSIKGLISTLYLALCGRISDVSELFGTTSKIGGEISPVISKTFFNDLKVVGNYKIILKSLPRLWSPRRRPEYPAVKYYLDVQYVEPKGINQFIECVDEGAKFQGNIIGYCLKPWEVGGLIMSLGLKVLNGKTYVKTLKVGYAKPQGLGKIRLILESLKVEKCEVDSQTLNPNIIVERNIKHYIDAFLEKYTESSKRYEEVFK
jgi:CRISPR/Cas system CSM-associated protein Csm3 (group 7 of RAMP superfamily)